MIGLVLALAFAAPAQEVHHPSQGEQLVSVLKLDGKTQVPAVQQILTDGQKDAAPVTQQLLQLREQMMNMAMAGKTPELSALADKYAVAAASLAKIEGNLFSKIYALLKPNQQAKAQEAFTVIGGLYLPPMHTISAPSGRGVGGGRAGAPAGGGN